ncbi:hypothetical protein AMTRI_Chr06g170900 [Amborella trichopoda]
MPFSLAFSFSLVLLKTHVSLYPHSLTYPDFLQCILSLPHIFSRRRYGAISLVPSSQSEIPALMYPSLLMNKHPSFQLLRLFLCTLTLPVT